MNQPTQQGMRGFYPFAKFALRSVNSNDSHMFVPHFRQSSAKVMNGEGKTMREIQRIHHSARKITAAAVAAVFALGQVVVPGPAWADGPTQTGSAQVESSSSTLTQAQEGQAGQNQLLQGMKAKAAALNQGPTGLEAGPAFIKTAFDNIPNFGANPTLASEKDGNWSEIFSRQPVAGDVVRISHDVTYNVVSDVALKTVMIEKGGALRFRTDMNTRLMVQNFLVLGTLEIGTVDKPVQASVKAEVIIANLPLDLANDLEQFGNVLLGLGKVTMHGAVKEQTFIRLASEPKAGDATLTLSQPATGWRVGDQLLVADTEGGSPNRTERPSITAISPDGRILTLSAPLQYDHSGGRGGDGNLMFLPTTVRL